MKLLIPGCGISYFPVFYFFLPLPDMFFLSFYGALETDLNYKSILVPLFPLHGQVVSLLATVVEHLVTGETMQMTTTSDQRCRYEIEDA